MTVTKIDKAYGIILGYKRDDIYEFLLIHHNKGHWGFPKGHALPNESSKQSAIRELQEETSVNIKEASSLNEKSFVEHYEYEEKGALIKKTVEYFLHIINIKPNIKIQKEEIQDYKWCTCGEANKLILFKEGKQLLSIINKYLSNL